MMQFAVGILTHNAISTLRMGLLAETVQSARLAFGSERLLVLDNGSTDGTDAAIPDLGTFLVREVPSDGNTSPGRGRNKIMQTMQDLGWLSGQAIVVLSDDDVRWSSLSGHLLKDFWRHAPNDLPLVSGLLEPDWPWNKPRELVEYGGVKALVRDSAPAAAWSFRWANWRRFGPLREDIDELGEDLDACQRLAKAGMRVAQLPIAEHTGEGYSQLGNDEARKLAGRPLDRAHWGI